MVLFALSSSGLNIWNGWFLLGCYIGTMLLDIDHNKSKLGRFFWLTTSRVHRKFTHSIVFCVIIGILGGLFRLWFGIGVAFGSLLHLVGDSYTGRLPYLYYPYKR